MDERVSLRDLDWAVLLSYRRYEKVKSLFFKRILSALFLPYLRRLLELLNRELLRARRNN